MLCLLPAATVEAGISALGSGITGVWAKGSFEAFFGAALPEELAKFLVLYFYCRRRSEFDEPMDGLVYGSAVGLGFAVLENAAYVFALDGGFAVAVVRAITAVPSHGAIGAIMGYCIALSGFAPKNRNRYLLLALVVPIVLHGLYDTVVLVVGALPAGSPTIVLLGVAFLFLIAMEFYFVKRLVDEHVDRQEAQVLSRDFASYIQVRVAGARREG